MQGAPGRRARVEAHGGCRRASICSTRRSFSASEPSHQTTRSGRTVVRDRPRPSAPQESCGDSRCRLSRVSTRDPADRTVGGTRCYSPAHAEALVLVLLAAGPAAVEKPVLVLRAGSLIDGAGGPARPDQTDRRSRRADRSRRLRRRGAPGRSRDRPCGHDRPAGPDRRPHPRLPPGRGPGGGRLRRQHPQPGRRVSRGSRERRGPPRPGAGLHDDPRSGHRGRGLRRRRDQARRSRLGYIPGPRMFVATLGDLDDRRLSPRGLCAGADAAQGRRDRRRPRRGAQGGARAARQGRRLDQGVHDAPVLGGQATGSSSPSRR